MPERTDAARDEERLGLQIFYQALSGSSALITTEEDQSFDDGRRVIRLPTDADHAWYRVAVAHRAMHDEMRTAGFRLTRPARRFEDLRGTIALPERDGDESDLELLMRSTPDGGLLLECYGMIEDARIDASITRRFAGLAHELRAVQARELAMRPPLERLSLRSALLEIVARHSVGWAGDVPATLAPLAQRLAALMAEVCTPEATVEDSVEASLRAWALIASAMRDSHAAAWEEGREVKRTVWFGERPVDDEGLREWVLMDMPVAAFSYRDAIEVALTGAPVADPESDAKVVDQLLAKVTGTRGEMPKNIADESAPSSSARTEATDPGELEPELGSWLYPEWDHRAGMYRERWTRVRESVPAASRSADAYRVALRERRELVADIRRQFERIAPETLRRVKGVRDGEDLDIDAAIDALADLREGIPPSENVYITRQRTQRDVAVVFLVDLSASTQDPVDTGHGYRRVLDVEREGLILLIEPLRLVGDVFGMYGFSGANRDDVRVVVLKDIKEPISNDVLARLDALSPMHTTRMGAAIRHAATKLKGIMASTRLLMVISDGRPFDVDYGQRYGDGAELDYAVHDTRAALDELRDQGIRPFLLTVDSRGADYLRTMCRDLDYEVLRDVSQLPARLAALYGHLTAHARPLA